MEDFAVVIKELTKVYKLYKKPSDRIKELFSFNHMNLHDDFYALDNVSFSVKRGESVGIIGKNGSGKSTLLKIITEVLSKTSGEVNINGRVSALLELGAGFNGEYNGIENIYLNGTLMGITHEEMDKKIQDIIDFADIGDFIYQPVKTYSSGMYVRLAFAIAINVDPDILIIDEALSVGDIRFQRKCFRKIEEFKKNKTFILVSHDLSSVVKFCDRVIWLNKGKIEMEGDPVEVSKAFKAYMIEAKFNHNVSLDLGNKKRGMYEFDTISNDVDIMGDGNANITGIICLDAQNNKNTVLDANRKIKVLIRADINNDLEDAIVGFTFKDKLGTVVFQVNSFVLDKKIDLRAGKDYIFLFEFTLPKLIDGYYTISPAIATGSQSYHVQHCWIFDALVIQVVNKMDINLEGYNYIDDAEFTIV